MLFVNLYNFFTALFFIGIEGFPRYAWLILELGTELISIFDVLIRIALGNSRIWSGLYLLHESTPFVFLLTASVPTSTIFYFCEDSVDLDD
jgi:hypothetical protein